MQFIKISSDFKTMYPKVKVCILVNGSQDSSMGMRAKGLAGYPNTVNILYRDKGRMRSMVRFLKIIRRENPNIIYVLNIGIAGVSATIIAKILWGYKFVIDTGDLVYELDKLLGNRTFIGLWAMYITEKLTLKLSSAIVVRGTFHKQLLEKMGYKNVFHIPDGVNTSFFKPMDARELRKKFGVERYLTIGTVGATIWNKRLKTCFGWELIEVLKLLKNEPVRGIMIGNGTGLPILKKRASESGVLDKIIFTDRIPHSEIPKYINLIDICISTQTNNPIGQVRTTGKLPEYLACGRYILATDVGEAKLVLPEEMRVEYIGTEDKLYPKKLAKKVMEILENPAILQNGRNGIKIAKQKFEYKISRKKLLFLFETSINHREHRD